MGQSRLIPQRGLFCTDRHFPAHDPLTNAALHHYIKDNQFDFLIDGGDLGDFDVISAHNKNNLRAVEGKRLTAQYDCMNRELDWLQAAQPKAAITLIEGNHEYRVTRYIAAHPEAEGILEVPTQLDLSGRGIEWIPFWSKGSIKKIGKASFGHGRYINEMHAKKHALAYCGNFFYGHQHGIQSYSVVNLGDNNTYMAQCCGCLCAYDQTYMQGRPSNWQQAFVEFTFRDDGYFNYNLVQIFAHSFVVNGRIYHAKGSRKL